MAVQQGQVLARLDNEGTDGRCPAGGAQAGRAERAPNPCRTRSLVERGLVTSSMSKRVRKDLADAQSDYDDALVQIGKTASPPRSLGYSASSPTPASRRWSRPARRSAALSLTARCCSTCRFPTRKSATSRWISPCGRLITPTRTRCSSATSQPLTRWWMPRRAPFAPWRR